jgi:H+-translocating NAD(P) transhydrogenase subunit alpha
MEDHPHGHLQPDHLRAGDLRRLPRGLERHPALHTPLMAVTNAISAIVIVGAMLAAGLTVTPMGKTMGTLAVALAAVNVFGGFLVTPRMLEMFKKKAARKRRGGAMNAMSMNLVTTALPDRLGLFHPGAQRPVAPDHLAARQPVRHARHGASRYSPPSASSIKLGADSWRLPGSATSSLACWSAVPPARSWPSASR